MRRLRHRLGRWLLRDFDETDLTAADLLDRLEKGAPAVIVEPPIFTVTTSTIPCRCDDAAEVCWLHDIQAWNLALRAV